MPLYKVHLWIRRYDEVLLEAENQEAAQQLAAINYDQCEKDPRIHWTQCEEEHILDGTEVLCLDDNGHEINCPEDEE